MDLKNTIIVYTDGACSGNPGKGGYGAIVALPEGHIDEIGGSSAATTNNKMEMTAVIEALMTLSERTEDIWLYTDSTYVIRGITQWIWGWRKNGWKTAEGNDVTNVSLWKKLDSLMATGNLRKRITWKYVRGHTGHPGNERCDQIAVDFTKGKRPSLYSGPLIKYDVAVYDLPEDVELPEMKPKGEKKVAHSYLSLVNGKLERHSTWKECEARVKGRPGAKFKKAMSESEELTIAKGWGLSASDLAKIDS